jgi:lysophospholipase L1-like esterase
VNNFFLVQKLHTPTNGTEIVILCIGESTTAWGLSDSYPSQLQNLLDLKYGKNIFRVVNEGVAGTDTSKIYKQLDYLVTHHKPDYVITMMGINDVWSISDDLSYFDNFKIYKFIKILNNHVKAYYLEKKAKQHRNTYANISDTATTADKHDLKLETDPLLVKMTSATYQYLIKNTRQFHGDANEKILNEALLKIQQTENLKIEDFYTLAVSLLEMKDKYEVQKILLELGKSVNDFRLFREIGKFYFVKYGRVDTFGNEAARKFLNSALEMRPTDEEALRYLSMSYSGNSKYTELALEIAKRNFDNGSRHPDTIWIIADVYRNTNRNELAIKYLKSGLYSDSDLEIWLWLRLIEIYIDSNDEENTKKYLALAYEKYTGNPKFREIEIRYRNKFSLSVDHLKRYTVKNFYEYPPTQNNYKKIANYFVSKNINLIVMQYPLRPIEPIKALLSDYSEIQYVENYPKFEMASKTSTYSELFTDTFAEDFGHFTLKSTQIIAQNIVDQVNFSIAD